MKSLFFVTVYFCSKCGLFYFRLYSYGNGRIVLLFYYHFAKHTKYTYKIFK